MSSELIDCERERIEEREIRKDEPSLESTKDFFDFLTFASDVSVLLNVRVALDKLTKLARFANE